jgi:hypothetical protein
VEVQDGAHLLVRLSKHAGLEHHRQAQVRHGVVLFDAQRMK